MSFKKIKIISPETALNGPRNPEVGYVYLGYGYSSTYDDTAPWIKKSDGSITLISGGTGGGGALYWQLLTGYLKPNNVSYKVSVGNTSAQQVFNVGGAISLSTTTTNSAGSIRYNSATPDFEGYVTGKGWVSLTASGSSAGTSGTNYWEPVVGVEGIIYPDNVYIGGGFSVGSTNDILNVDGGITLSETNKENDGTMHYYTSVPANEGFYGRVDSDWKRLDVFEYNTTNHRAYYSGNVLIGGSDISVIDPDLELFVSGRTESIDVVTIYDSAVPSHHGPVVGGFGGYSGGTLAWGISGSFVVGASGLDASYTDYTLHIVNGIVVDFEGRTSK